MKERGDKRRGDCKTHATTTFKKEENRKKRTPREKWAKLCDIGPIGRSRKKNNAQHQRIKTTRETHNTNRHTSGGNDKNSGQS